MKSYAVSVFKASMHLMKSMTAFAAVSTAENADSIILAILIFPMVVSLLRFIAFYMLE